jgi:hypothetical protein
VINVSTPDVRVEAPVHVEAPVINLTVSGRKVERIPERDARGLITKITEREIDDDDGD